MNIDEKKQLPYPVIHIFLFVYFFTLILKMQSNVQQYCPSFYTFYESHFFPGQTPIPPRSGTWILDLSHDPIWAIWLAEVRKFHQHHDRISNYVVWFVSRKPEVRIGGTVVPAVKRSIVFGQLLIDTCTGVTLCFLCIDISENSISKCIGLICNPNIGHESDDCWCTFDI